MNPLNRRGILATGLTSLFSLFGSAVFAAQGPTLKPKRVGQILDWRNK